MSRTHAATAVALLVAAVIGWSRLHAEAPAPAPESPPAIQIAPSAGASTGASGDGGPAEAVLVHVAGAVRHPGVYRLRDGERVNDAVRRAGGASRRADLAAVNLAAKVQDGRQVLVPERARRPVAASSAGEARAAQTPSGPLNLNTATLEQLDTLDGVGPATAQKILDFREAHGGFGSVEELSQIAGIGERRMAGLREAVTV
jgi:competence protein ComEA